MLVAGQEFVKRIALGPRLPGSTTEVKVFVFCVLKETGEIEDLFTK
jgi:hypothetical protein